MTDTLVRRLVAGLLFAGFGVLAGRAVATEEAHIAADESAERQRLAVQRLRIEAYHDARELECAERFAVTACLDESRAERRRGLADIKAQLSVLDSRQRTQRAAARKRRIDAKVARRAQAPQTGARVPLSPPLLPVDAAR